MEKKLQFVFEDDGGKTKSLSIDNLKDTITPEMAQEAAEKIINAKVLETNAKKLITKVKSAKLISQNITELI